MGIAGRFPHQYQPGAWLAGSGAMALYNLDRQNLDVCDRKRCRGAIGLAQPVFIRMERSAGGTPQEYSLCNPH